MLINDRLKLQNFFEFQKANHSPDLPLPLYLHADDMRLMERSQSNAFENEHKLSIADAFWRIKNDTLVKVGAEIANEAFKTQWPEGKGKAIAICAIIPKAEYFFDAMYKSKAGGDYFEYQFNERFICIITTTRK